MQNSDLYVERGKIPRAERSAELTGLNDLITSCLNNNVYPASVVVLPGPRGCGKTQMAFSLSHTIYYMSVRDNFICTTQSDTEPNVLSLLPNSTIMETLTDDVKIMLSIDGLSTLQYNRLPMDTPISILGIIYAMLTGEYSVKPHTIHTLQLTLRNMVNRPALFIDHMISDTFSTFTMRLLRNVCRKIGLTTIWTNSDVINCECLGGYPQCSRIEYSPFGHIYCNFPLVSTQLILPFHQLDDSFNQTIYPLILHARPDLAWLSKQFWSEQKDHNNDLVLKWLNILGSYLATITSNEQRISLMKHEYDTDFWIQSSGRPNTGIKIGSCSDQWFSYTQPSIYQDVYKCEPPTDIVSKLAITLSLLPNLLQDPKKRMEKDTAYRLIVSASHHRLTGTPFDEYMKYLVNDLKNYFSNQSMDQKDSSTEELSTKLYLVDQPVIPFLVPNGPWQFRSSVNESFQPIDKTCEMSAEYYIKHITRENTHDVIKRLQRFATSSRVVRIFLIFCLSIDDTIMIRRTDRFTNINALMLVKKDGCLTLESLFNQNYVDPLEKLVIYIPMSVFQV